MLRVLDRITCSSVLSLANQNGEREFQINVFKNLSFICFCNSNFRLLCTRNVFYVRVINLMIC